VRSRHHTTISLALAFADGRRVLSPTSECGIITTAVSLSNERRAVELDRPERPHAELESVVHLDPLPVASQNDWDPLEEVVVGDPFHLGYSPDVSSSLFYEIPLDDERWQAAGLAAGATNGTLRRLEEELAEDLEGFLDVLVEAGVVVRRLEPLEPPSEIVTPNWRALSGHATMPRDLVLVVGDELIETPPLVRSRYFETFSYRRLLLDYFERGARWTVAPRPRMGDGSFDYSYAVANGWTDAVPAATATEPMFDAAQILRLGRDLVFNCSTENHRAGRRWLARHLGGRYRVHEVELGANRMRLAKDHLDCVLIALRPGTLLAHDALDLSSLPPWLQDWEVVRYDSSKLVDGTETYGLPVLASPLIGANVLSLDQDRVVVQSEQTDLMRRLERHGFTPVPCRWRHGRLVGGGFHCLTLDVRRAGVLEDYAAG
jgi:glycine amidinotransferase